MGIEALGGYPSGRSYYAYASANPRAQSFMTPALDAAAFECAKELLNSNSEVCLISNGGSMRPFIQEGDRLRIVRSQAPRRAGEIVWAERDGIDVIHRIIKTSSDDRFEMRGDALPHSDGWFDREAYIGTIISVERGRVVRSAPETRGHRCFVAFIRGLRHIEWKFTARFNRCG